MNDRINELIELLRAEVFKAWDKGTNASITIEPDGFTMLSVDRWDRNEDLPAEAWKRRQIYDSWKTSTDDEWKADRSEEQNAYYKAHKLLLEEE